MTIRLQRSVNKNPKIEVNDYISLEEDREGNPIER
jgi:hypothetical protein